MPCRQRTVADPRARLIGSRCPTLPSSCLPRRGSGGHRELVRAVVERLVGVGRRRSRARAPSASAPSRGGATSASSAISRSWFLTGVPAAVFQPLRFQPGSHFVIELSISCESVTTTTFEPSGSERRPSSAAVSSIRLLVVSFSPPESSIGSAPSAGMTIAAQPPGPGLPLQAPSVQMTASPGSTSTGESLRGASGGDPRRGWGQPQYRTPSRPIVRTATDSRSLCHGE